MKARGCTVIEYEEVAKVEILGKLDYQALLFLSYLLYYRIMFTKRRSEFKWFTYPKSLNADPKI